VEFIRAVLSELMNRSRFRIAIHVVEFAAIACGVVMAHAQQAAPPLARSVSHMLRDPQSKDLREREASFAHGQQVPPLTPGLPTLTRAEQTRELSPAEANRGYPVRLRAIVTFVDDFALFVQDSSAGIAVIASGLSHDVHAGQLVELEGITECPDFAPQINKARIQVVGEAPMPLPKRVSFERLASTKEDSQWVEVEGIVRAVVSDTIPIPPAADVSPAVAVAVNGGRLLARVPGCPKLKRRGSWIPGCASAAWLAQCITRRTNGWGPACSSPTGRNSKSLNRHPPIRSPFPCNPFRW
jgi:hypothetical protein